MSFETYRSQVVIDCLGKRSRSTFFFLADNSGGFHCHRVASALNFSLSVETDWLFYFSSMISEHAFIRELRTRRVRPDPGPSAYNRWSLISFPGRYLGDMGDNFICAKLQWHPTVDASGKFVSRIGPVGEGATQTNGWYPIFFSAAEQFVIEHVATRTLDIGIQAHGSTDNLAWPDSLIESATLHWPPTRQKNRRAPK